MIQHLAHAQTNPPIAALVAQFFEEAPRSVQSSLISALLKSVGTLAMVVVAAGAFSRFLPLRTTEEIQVTSDSVEGISPKQVQELARFVEQKSPELLVRLPDLVGNVKAWTTTPSGHQLLKSLQALQGGGH